MCFWVVREHCQDQFFEEMDVWKRKKPLLELQRLDYELER